MRGHYKRRQHMRGRWAHRPPILRAQVVDGEACQAGAGAGGMMNQATR